MRRYEIVAVVILGALLIFDSAIAGYDSVLEEIQTSEGLAQSNFMVGDSILAKFSVFNINTDHYRRSEFYDTENNLLWSVEDNDPVVVPNGESWLSIFPITLNNVQVGNYTVRSGVKEGGDADYTYLPEGVASFSVAGELYYNPVFTVTDSLGASSVSFQEGEYVNFSFSAEDFSIGHQLRFSIEDASGVEVYAREGDIVNINPMFLHESSSLTGSIGSLAQGTYTAKAFLKLGSADFLHLDTLDVVFSVEPADPPAAYETASQVVQNTEGIEQYFFSVGEPIVTNFVITNVTRSHIFMVRMFAKDGITLLREIEASDWNTVNEGDTLPESFYRYEYNNVSIGTYVFRSYTKVDPAGSYIYEEGTEKTVTVTGDDYYNPSLVVADNGMVPGSNFSVGSNIYFEARADNISKSYELIIDIINANEQVVHTQSSGVRTQTPGYLRPEALFYYYYDLLPIGDYRAEFWISIDGYSPVHLDALDKLFSVVEAPPPADYDSPTLILRNSSSIEQYDFLVGETLQADFSIQNVTVPHRFKIVVYNDQGQAMRTVEANNWNNVPDGETWGNVPFVIDFDNMPLSSGYVRGYVQTDPDGDFIYHEGTEKSFVVSGENFYDPRLEILDEGLNPITSIDFGEIMKIRWAVYDISKDHQLRFVIKDTLDNIIRTENWGFIDLNPGELRTSTSMILPVDNLPPGDYVVEGHVSIEGGSFAHVPEQDAFVSVYGDAFYFPKLSVTDSNGNEKTEFSSAEIMRVKFQAEDISQSMRLVFSITDNDGIPSVYQTPVYVVPPGSLLEYADITREISGLKEGDYLIKTYVMIDSSLVEIPNQERVVNITPPKPYGSWSAQICVLRNGQEHCFSDTQAQGLDDYIIAGEQIVAKLGIEGVRNRHNMGIIVRREYGNVIDWDGGWRTVPVGEAWSYVTPLSAKADIVADYQATFSFEVDGVASIPDKIINFKVYAVPPEIPESEPGSAMPWLMLLLK